MNYVIIVGRIDEIIEVSKSQIDMVINVSHKVDDKTGINRKAKVNVYNTIAENVVKYCKSKDVVSVKGYIDMEKDNNIIVAEQVSFMSSTPPIK